MSTHHHGKGYLPEPHVTLYRSFHAAHPAAVKPMSLGLPDSVSLMPFEPPIQDQDGVGRCVGEAIGGALYTLLGSKGFPPPAPFSARAAYDLAREIDRADLNPVGDLPPLVDVGCQPNQCVRAVGKFGLADIAQVDGGDSTVDPAKINVDLTLAEFEACRRRLVSPLKDITWTAIADGDPNKLAQVDQSLAAGYPVVFAMDADPTFDGYAGFATNGLLCYVGTAPNHMQRVVSYRTMPDGSRQYLQVNSWGPNWADGGMAWVWAGSIASYTYNMLIPRLP
jgi:hypothetical protein